jgi:hypothetical protein
VERIDVVTTSEEKVGDIYEFAEKLARHIRDRKFTDVEQFLKAVRRFALMLNLEGLSPKGDVTVKHVTEYLLRNTFKQTPVRALEYYVAELDVDSDGFVTD